METLADVVRKTVFEYASAGINLRTFPLANEEDQVYAVNVIDVPVREQPAGVVVIARVAGDKVIIEEDTTDRPLAEALVRNGVPPEKIIKAYAGEPIPVEENP